MWGISIIAAVLAGGLFWLGRVAVRKEVAKGTPNKWARFVLDLVGGVFMAIATMPILKWADGADWFAIACAIAFAGLAIGTLLDIGSDKKPDRWAISAAKVMPALLLITLWTGGHAASTEGGKMFSQYSAEMTSGR